jgi:hypothetical protein
MTRIKGFPRVGDLARRLAALKRGVRPGGVCEVASHVIDGGWHVHRGALCGRGPWWGWWGDGFLTRRTDVKKLARYLLAMAEGDRELFPDAGRTPVPEPRRDSLHLLGF